jgi:DNA mismatch repair ATPase MutS
MVETTIDLDAIDNHEYIIKPEFDNNLKVIKKRLDKVRADIHQEHKRVGRDLDQELDKKLMLENHKSYGWSFRLTRNVRAMFPFGLANRPQEAGCIRNKRTQYTEISTQKNGVLFTTTTLQSLRRNFDQLSENYNRTQSGLAAEIVTIACKTTTWSSPV